MAGKAMLYNFHDASRSPKLRTSPSGLRLKDGEFKEIQNWRSANGELVVRGGTAIFESVVSAANFRGGCVTRFKGVEVIFLAVYIPLSLKVRVYRYPQSDGTADFEEITRQFNGSGTDTGIGPYDLTRMDDDGFVWFEMFEDNDIAVMIHPSTSSSYTKDVLCFGNRSSFPRAYSPFWGGNSLAVTNAPGTMQTAIIEDIDPPTAAQGVGTRVTMCGAFGFPIRDAANCAYRNSSAQFAMADSGASATDNHALLTVTSTAAVNDTSVIDVNSGGINGAVPLLGGKQLHIGVETAWVSFLQSVKIEVGGESAGVFTSAATIWDGTGASVPFPVVSILGTNQFLYSFDVEQFYSASNYDALRFTFLGPVVGSTQTVKLFYVQPGVAIAGANPGQTAWCVTWFNSGSHTESPPVFLRAPTYPLRLETLGGNEVPDSFLALVPPSSVGIYWGFNIPCPNPTQAQINKGVDACRIYRKRPEDEDYFLQEHYELAIYSETPAVPPAGPTGPTWSFISGSASSIVRIGTLGRRYLSTTVPPHDLHKAMPKAFCAAQCNGRAFVGQYAVNATKPGFLYSVYQQMFRFLDKDDINVDTGEFYPLSAGYVNVQGDQIRAMAAVSASLVGFNSAGPSDMVVLAFGERDVYITGGKTVDQIRRLAPMGIPGTISPGSVAVGKQWVYYVDRYMVPRRIRGGGIDDPIGLQRVDSVFKACPSAMRQYQWGFYHDSKYYCTTFPASWEDTTDQNLVGVFDEHLDDWVSIDLPPLCFEGGFSYFDSSTNSMKLIALMQQVGAGTTLVAYTYDDPAVTTDLGTAIATAIRTLEWHSVNWDVVAPRKFHLMMQAAAGKTMTVVISAKPSGNTRTTTLDLDAQSGETYIRMTDRPETASETTEMKGGSLSLYLTASLPGGTSLYSFGLDIEEYEEEYWSPAP